MNQYHEFIENQGYTLYNTFTPGMMEFHIKSNDYKHKECIIVDVDKLDLMTFDKKPDGGFNIVHHPLTLKNLEKIIKQKKLEVKNG